MSGVSGRVAANYAGALFARTRSDSLSFVTALEQLRTLVKRLSSQLGFLKMIRARLKSADEKISALLRLVDGTGIDKNLLEILLLMVHNNRFSLKSLIALEFECERRALSAGLSNKSIELTTARPLTAEEMNEASAIAARHSLRLCLVVDQRLLGGVAIQIGNRVVDLSVRRKLSIIKKAIQSR